MLTCAFEDGNPVSLRHVTCNAIIQKDNQVVLIKRSGKYTEPYKWGLPGGFMDRDENLFECITREVFEETGFKIVQPKLFLIVHLPHRRHEDRQNIDVIFTASPGEKIGESDHEIEQVKWFDIPNIPQPEDMAFDHGLVLHRYFEHLRSPATLPILDFSY